MEPKVLLLCSQVPATFSWPKPHKFIPYHMIYFRSILVFLSHLHLRNTHAKEHEDKKCPGAVNICNYIYKCFIIISLSTKVIFPSTGNKEWKLVKTAYLNCAYFFTGVSTYDYVVKRAGLLKPGMLQMSSS